MISIIICSVDPQLLRKLVLKYQGNYRGRIEIIAPDNSIDSSEYAKYIMKAPRRQNFQLSVLA
jgi:hypothetical protein